MSCLVSPQSTDKRDLSEGVWTPACRRPRTWVTLPRQVRPAARTLASSAASPLSLCPAARAEACRQLGQSGLLPSLASATRPPWGLNKLWDLEGGEAGTRPPTYRSSAQEKGRGLWAPGLLARPDLICPEWKEGERVGWRQG